MKKSLMFFLATTILLSGCNKKIGEYIPLSAISNDGFARDADYLKSLEGTEVKVWGFVDPDNIFVGDINGVNDILGDWSAGRAPNHSSWRFNLKAYADDATGMSVPIHVTNDGARDILLKYFVDDARAQRATQVFVTGEIVTFDAPTNFLLLTGFIVKSAGSGDILLQAPKVIDDDSSQKK